MTDGMSDGVGTEGRGGRSNGENDRGGLLVTILESKESRSSGISGQ